jgi:hypothetical protein
MHYILQYGNRNYTDIMATNNYHLADTKRGSAFNNNFHSGKFFVLKSLVPTQSSQDKEKLTCPFQSTDNFPEWTDLD